MPDFNQINGRLAEVHRYINVPMRWSEQYPSRERRELWITLADGNEVKLVVHTREMPARSGHMVSALLWGGKVVGMKNLSTGQSVNFTEADPPLIFRRADALRLLSALGPACVGISVFSDTRWLVVLLPASLAVTVLIACLRIVGRSWLRYRVSDCLGKAAVPCRKAALRRVK